MIKRMDAIIFRSLIASAISCFCLHCGLEADHTGETSIPEKIDFNLHVRPILSDRCFKCHGPDDRARKANFRLDEEAFAFEMLDSIAERFAIVRGRPGKSELYARITSEDPKEKMPPPESNLILTPTEILVLKRWIEQGAEWKTHWSFIKPVRTPLPGGAKDKWPRNEIDYFTLVQMRRVQLEPSVAATPEKLIRRLSFDLTGLPPSPQEVNEFKRDPSIQAYEELVDRLLASPAYGERMASDWLDLSRYAETNGYHHDFERNVWPWRDWVIQSFNDNRPYDEFVTWQLAGDLLENPSYEQLLATSFNRLHRTTQECGSIDEEFRVSYVVDRTNTFGKAFLGLTVECAQCHDHKYDPISQREYYKLFAFFNQVPERGVTKSFGNPSAPYLALPDEQVEEVRAYIDQTIEREYASGSQQDSAEAYRDVWREEMSALVAPVMIMGVLDTTRPTYVLDRGLYDAPGEEVFAGTPPAILPFGKGEPADRLGLARWLFNPDHPLTARVVVNRYWQMIFGRGLVDTPDDFGSQGALPTHLELLDWLAVDFMESGWDVKRLIKQMVLSATYRQSSVITPAKEQADPYNKWLARGVQGRLTAEMLRDQALQMSGLLVNRIGGPSVKSYHPKGLWVQVSSGGRYQRKYMQGHGEDLYRRSLYQYWKRIQPPPSMTIFDAANRNQCTVKRQSSSTPLQALVLLNDVQFMEAARFFAERSIREGGNNAKERIQWAFQWATSRLPDEAELSILLELLEEQVLEFSNYPERAEAIVDLGEGGSGQMVGTEELAAYTMVCNAVMNLSESLQKN